jgi:hypothetical protein
VKRRRDYQDIDLSLLILLQGLEACFCLESAFASNPTDKGLDSLREVVKQPAAPVDLGISHR